MRDQAYVQFDLTREQAEKERRADRLERLKRDAEHQEGVHLLDRESEMALRRDELAPKGYHHEQRDSDYGDWEQYRRDSRGEKDPTSWIGAATAGAMGAAAAATVLSGKASNDGSSESSQRRHYERSEKRRAERRRMPGPESILSNLPVSDRARDTIDESPDAAHPLEHIKTSAFRDISRKKPIYDDYAQFFAPEELRYSPDTYTRREPASMPTIIEVEPSSEKTRPTEELHGRLPWPVPELKLIEPTPPQSLSGSVRDIASPTPSPPYVSQGDRTSERPATGSHVSWGKHETHEYDVPSTSSDLDSADHDFATDREQEDQIGSKPARDLPRTLTEISSSKSATSDYGADIEFAATVAAATAAAGFGPSLVSDIREKLVSPPQTTYGYVEGEAETPDDEAKQLVADQIIEDRPLHSEPESVSEGDRTLRKVRPTSTIAQEVIRQLAGKQTPGMGELSRRAGEEMNEGQRALSFRGRRAESESPPEKAFPMPGGFEVEEPFSQQKLRGNEQEIAKDDIRSVVSAPVPGEHETLAEMDSHRNDSREIDDRATSPTGEDGSAEGKKKRRKRRSKRDIDAFEDSISVTSSPARVEQAGDRLRSTEEKAKEKKSGGLFSNIFGSKASEPVASKISSSSDRRPSREIQSEVNPRTSEEFRRQRREERRRQKYGELMDSGITMGVEKV
jgi:hypothetical protein